MFCSRPLEGTENDSTQSLINSPVSRELPFSGASASPKEIENQGNNHDDAWSYKYKYIAHLLYPAVKTS